MSGMPLDVLQPILEVAAGGARLFGMESSYAGRRVRISTPPTHSSRTSAARGRTRGGPDVSSLPWRRRGLCHPQCASGSTCLLGSSSRTRSSRASWRSSRRREASRKSGSRSTSSTTSRSALTPGLSDPFREARRLGFRIALDDVRLSNADQCTLVACRPDDLKPDGLLVAGVRREPRPTRAPGSSATLDHAARSGADRGRGGAPGRVGRGPGPRHQSRPGYLLCPPLAASVLEGRDFFGGA